MKENLFIDAAICIATEVIGENGTVPGEGISETAGHIVVRRGNSVVILGDVYRYVRQALDIFGPAAFTAAAFGENGAHLGRAYVKLSLPSKKTGRIKLEEFHTPVRVAFRYEKSRAVRANIDTSSAVKMPATYGQKGPVRKSVANVFADQ